MRRRVRAVAAMALALSGLEAGWVSAAEYVVPTDFALIEEAVAAAAHGDTVTVLPGEHLIVDFLAWGSRDLVVRSLSGPAVTTIRGVNGGSGWDHVIISGGATQASVLEGFTLAEFLEGAIDINDASPTLRNLVIVDCGVAADFAPYGGGIYCENGSPVLIGVRFISNEALTGGAFYCSGGSPTFFGCTFESNWAVDGGAVYLSTSNASFVACDFIDNDARTYFSWDSLVYVDGHGGAVNAFRGAPSFSQCRFVHNRARDFVQHDTVALGGCGYFTYQSAPTFTGCTIVESGASTLGGAILATVGAQLTFSSTIIAFTSEGGGLVVEGVTAGATLACCDVYGNNGGDYVGMLDPTGQDGNISANPLFCDSGAREYTLATGSPCLPAGNDCGVQIGAHGEGCAWPTAVEDAPAPAGGGVALDCHPNPFNPTTVFSFEVPAPARVSLTVYDVTGRHVQSLVHTDLPAGQHAVDFDGSGLGSGVYLAVLRIGERHAERKFTLVK